MKLKYDADGDDAFVAQVKFQNPKGADKGGRICIFNNSYHVLIQKNDWASLSNVVLTYSTKLTTCITYRTTFEAPL